MKPVDFLTKQILEMQYRKLQLNPVEFFRSQEKLWKKTQDSLRDTEIFNDQKLDYIDTYEDYVKHVPVSDFATYEKYVNRIIAGETNVLFNDDIQYFGLTSGTSGKDSKRIPYNNRLLKLFLKAQKYTASIVTHNAKVNVLTSDRLTFGSAPISYSDENFQYGYISGILATKTPRYLKNKTFPSAETLEITQWDTKIEALLNESIERDIKLVSGIPTYIITIFEAILERTGKRYIKEIWPNITAFIYGATPILQYKDRLNELVGKELHYIGLYAATEAPIGLAYSDTTYILNPDILYSFSHRDSENEMLNVLELEEGEEYFVHVGTPNGILNYAMKDIIKIVSLDPVIEFEVVGRQSTGMNLAAEKVSDQHILNTIVKVKEELNLDIRHYFVSPQMKNGRPSYLWTLFVSDDQKFNKVELLKKLDRHLRKFCEDYDDCRIDGIISDPDVKFLSLDILEKYFHENQHKGQFKMKTTFPAENVFNEFLMDLVGAPA